LKEKELGRVQRGVLKEKLRGRRVGKKTLRRREFKREVKQYESLVAL
jgi:hypothetical protein